MFVPSNLNTLKKALIGTGFSLSLLISCYGNKLFVCLGHQDLQLSSSSLCTAVVITVYTSLNPLRQTGNVCRV